MLGPGLLDLKIEPWSIFEISPYVISLIFIELRIAQKQFPLLYLDSNLNF